MSRKTETLQVLSAITDCIKSSPEAVDYGIEITRGDDVVRVQLSTYEAPTFYLLAEHFMLPDTPTCTFGCWWTWELNLPLFKLEISTSSFVFDEVRALREGRTYELQMPCE